MSNADIIYIGTQYSVTGGDELLLFHRNCIRSVVYRALYIVKKTTGGFIDQGKGLI